MGVFRFRNESYSGKNIYKIIGKSACRLKIAVFYFLSQATCVKNGGLFSLLRSAVSNMLCVIERMQHNNLNLTGFVIQTH